MYIYVKKYNVCKKWSQDHGTCNEKRIHQNLTTSLKNKLKIKKLSLYLVYPISYASSPLNT